MEEHLIVETDRHHRVATGLTNNTAEVFLLGAHTERYGDPEVVVWLDAAQARQVGQHLVALAAELDRRAAASTDEAG